MKKYLAAALGVAFCIASPAFGQSTSSYRLNPSLTDVMATSFFTSTQASCTAAGSLLLKTQGVATVSVVITGTFVGTLQFKAAADNGVTYNAVNAYPQAGGAAVTSATATGTWFIAAAGYQFVCVIASAYTSGTATVWLEGSTAVQRQFSGADLATVAGGAIALGVTTASASLPVVIASDDGLKPAQNSTTSGQTGPLVQAATTTAAPSYTTAKTNPLSTDVSGHLRVVADTATGTAGSAATGVLSVQGIASMTPVQVGGPSADGATASGSPVMEGIKGVADAAQPTAVTAGQSSYAIGTLERIPIFTTRHPNHFQCQVAVSTATTIQAVGGSCATPGAGLSLYITDISFGTNAAGIAADSFNTLKSGTGGTCGAATAVIYQCMTAAATQAQCEAHLQQPIKVTANNEVCWINSTAGSKTLNLMGYIAP